MPNKIVLQGFNLSTLGHPAIAPIQLLAQAMQKLNSTMQREEALVVLEHRIFSENSTNLGEINSVIFEFNEDINFNSTFALVATWIVPDMVSYKIVL